MPYKDNINSYEFHPTITVDVDRLAQVVDVSVDWDECGPMPMVGTMAQIACAKVNLVTQAIDEMVHDLLVDGEYVEDN